MNIIVKESIFPIIIKTECYEDRFGNQNGFIEMNPSLCISEDGSYIILVRTVNYLKYPNNRFTVYGFKHPEPYTHVSDSKYTIIRGKINDTFNLDNYTVEPLDIQYNTKPTLSMWSGVEDIRFITDTVIIGCIPECNDGTPCIFGGILKDNTISSFMKCSPNISEKNWMPYIHEKPKVIYSISPFIIKSIVEDDREEIILSNEQIKELSGWHGSSNGIDFRNSKLFLIHKTEDRVYSRWLFFNPTTKEVSYSKKFMFFKDSYLEFTCSLAKYNDKLYISLGVNDNKAYIVQVLQAEIMKLFD
jgi:hypothetical protein